MTRAALAVYSLDWNELDRARHDACVMAGFAQPNPLAIGPPFRHPAVSDFLAAEFTVLMIPPTNAAKESRARVGGQM